MAKGVKKTNDAVDRHPVCIGGYFVVIQMKRDFGFLVNSLFYFALSVCLGNKI
jgi:hypothetical protein